MEIDQEHLRVHELGTKLNQIRWGQGLLFLERWFAIFFAVTLILTEFNTTAVVAFGIAIFLTFLYASTRQAALEDSIGLPGQRITIKI